METVEWTLSDYEAFAKTYANQKADQIIAALERERNVLCPSFAGSGKSFAVNIVLDRMKLQRGEYVKCAMTGEKIRFQSDLDHLLISFQTKLQQGFPLAIARLIVNLLRLTEAAASIMRGCALMSSPSNEYCPTDLHTAFFAHVGHPFDIDPARTVLVKSVKRVSYSWPSEHLIMWSMTLRLGHL